MSEGVRPETLTRNMTKFRDFLSFMTKLLNIDTLFMTKIAQDHILWERTYKYGPCKGVPPGFASR